MLLGYAASSTNMAGDCYLTNVLSRKFQVRWSFVSALSFDPHLLRGEKFVKMFPIHIFIFFKTITIFCCILFWYFHPEKIYTLLLIIHVALSASPFAPQHKSSGILRPFLITWCIYALTLWCNYEIVDMWRFCYCPNVNQLQFNRGLLDRLAIRMYSYIIAELIRV